MTEYFYLKINEIDKIYSNEAVRFLQGPAHGQCITLGGAGRDGKDATNELSIIMLRADYRVRLSQPDLAVRISGESPDSFLEEIANTIKEGINKVKVFGDEVVIDAMRTLDTLPGDAEDYAILGCSEPVITGKTNSWGNSGQINLAKCLELALNDGKCQMTGRQMGPRTGDMRKAEDFEDVFEAFRTQVEYFTDAIAAYDGILEYCQKNYYPLPLYSIVTQDCIKNGIEFNAAAHVLTRPHPGGRRGNGGRFPAGGKTLVFDQKKLTMEKLLDVLKKDFENEEVVRQMLMNRAPKFGNDDAEADEMCNRVLHVYVDALNQHTNNRGGRFIGGLYYVTSYIPYGRVTGATPDGRKATLPLNDGGISPSHGMDRKGHTAIARSVSSLDNVDVLHGCVLNQKFHPSVFTGKDKYKDFMGYLRGFTQLGCWECQYNVVTTETLRKAQKDPDRYKGLVVRVAGYSAYFTELEPELQEEVINRTEHMA
jgi:formate C-acetyltransferase